MSEPARPAAVPDPPNRSIPVLTYVGNVDSPFFRGLSRACREGGVILETAPSADLTASVDVDRSLPDPSGVHGDRNLPAVAQAVMDRLRSLDPAPAVCVVGHGRLALVMLRALRRSPGFDEVFQISHDGTVPAPEGDVPLAVVNCTPATHLDSSGYPVSLLADLGGHLTGIDGLVGPEALYRPGRDTCAIIVERTKERGVGVVVDSPGTCGGSKVRDETEDER